MKTPSRSTLGKLSMFVTLIGIEIWLGHTMSATPTIRGYVDTRSFGVSSSTKGLIRKLEVTLGQAVTAGQVIAEMDPGSLEDEIAVETAERRRVLTAIRGRLDATTGSNGSGVPAKATDAENPVSAESLRVIDLRLEQLAAQRDGMRLKSPVDGVVETIDVRPGDAVGPNSPVASIVTRDARRVIACIPENRIHDVEVGRSAEVQTPAEDRMLTGAVESLTPAIAPLPTRCQSPFAKIPAVGRVAVVLLDQAADLLPGQTQLVAFGADKRVLPVLPVAEIRRAPVSIDVSAELVTTSRFEPSGLVWVASLDRYLVVSDETGIEGGVVHPPWLFTMSRRGVVDTEPMLVEGIGEFDDLESITAADGGAIWVAASQSQSEKGNRPKQREHILRLVPSPGGYKVDAKVRLAELLDAAPDATRAALGLTDTRALDIEGMAWRAGALYLGLKAPVDGSKRAMIWRVGAPDHLLAGDLAGADITIWGRVALTVDVDGTKVPGGIADMMFVDDMSLLVGVTASGISAKHQIGGLVFVTRAGLREGAELTMTPIDTFPQLRPEGVAASPDLHRIVIVFDRGRETPMWLEREQPVLPPRSAH